MPRTVERCDTCKFWEIIKQDPYGNQGYCRRNPPARAERSDKEVIEHANPPVTKSHEWCGQYVKA